MGEGNSESATGYTARATDAGDLSTFAVDVVGQGSLADQAIPASHVIASALTRMETQARERDPEATLGTIQFFTFLYDPTSQRAEWDMNVHGRLYIANLDGTNFHSPGEGAGTLTNPEAQPHRAQRAQARSHCISQATGDAAKNSAASGSSRNRGIALTPSSPPAEGRGQPSSGYEAHSGNGDDR